MQRLEKHIGIVLIELRTSVFDGNSVLGRDGDARRLFFRTGLNSEFATLLAVNGSKKCGAQNSIGCATHWLWPHRKLHRAFLGARCLVGGKLGVGLYGFLQAGKLALEIGI